VRLNSTGAVLVDKMIDHANYMRESSNDELQQLLRCSYAHHCEQATCYTKKARNQLCADTVYCTR
jgi:hypothetical protein